MNKFLKILLSLLIIFIIVGSIAIGYKIYQQQTKEEEITQAIVSVDNRTEVVKFAQVRLDDEAFYVDIDCAQDCLLIITIYENDLLILQYRVIVSESYQIKYCDYNCSKYLVVLENY